MSPPRADRPHTRQGARAAAAPYPASRPARRNTAGSGADTDPIASSSALAEKPPRPSRQQYSACGACRVRRVKCDLKNREVVSTGERPVCSNCVERGINCVDEYADMKSLKTKKQLRRGRRLQQAEQMYGKASDEDDDGKAPAKTRSVIPYPKPEFFDSQFFHAFMVQRPIIDPAEFAQRYLAFDRGDSAALGSVGRLIAKLLVVWAASFGLNEAGMPVEERPDDKSSPGTATGGEHQPETPRAERQRITNRMVEEVLSKIDRYGILRRPSWDGVRVLLLVLPLTVDSQPQLDQLAMHEATLSQIYTLCSLEQVSSVNSGNGPLGDALVRARIFWYAHITEGVSSGLRGGRMILTDDDLRSFQRTLPPVGDHPTGHVLDAVTFPFAKRMADLLLEINSACRLVHACLSGPRVRNSECLIDEAMLEDTWKSLDQSWTMLEQARVYGAGGPIHEEEIERFIHGWQIFLFEAYNIIREALRQRILTLQASASAHPHSPPAQGRDTLQHRLNQAYLLHQTSVTKCGDTIREVVEIIRHQMSLSASAVDGQPSFFAFDASLARDGCFFAAFLLATDQSSLYCTTEEDWAADIDLCLSALRAMRWAFSKSDEREQAVRMVWDMTKRQRLAGTGAGATPPPPPPPTFASPPGPPRDDRRLPPPMSLYEQRYTAASYPLDASWSSSPMGLPAAHLTPMTMAGSAAPTYRAPTHPPPYTTSPDSSRSRPSSSGADSVARHQHVHGQSLSGYYGGGTTAVGGTGVLDGSPFSYTTSSPSLGHGGHDGHAHAHGARMAGQLMEQLPTLHGAHMGASGAAAGSVRPPVPVIATSMAAYAGTYVDLEPQPHSAAALYPHTWSAMGLPPGVDPDQ